MKAKYYEVYAFDKIQKSDGLEYIIILFMNTYKESRQANEINTFNLSLSKLEISAG